MAHLSLSELFPNVFLNKSIFQQGLGEDFLLCDNGNIIFHWADYHETCDLVKKYLEYDNELSDELKCKEVSLSRLLLIPVWIKTEKKVHQTTVFALYESYILNKLQLSHDEDPFGAIKLSFISSTGPFRSMAITECFNKSTYKDFVMVNLLMGKLPKRDYRIRLKAKVLMEYGYDFSSAGLINLEQLTMNGLLFSLDSDFFSKEVCKNGELRILIDTNILHEACEKDLAALKTHFAPFAFNLMYSSRKEDSIVYKVKDFKIQSSFDFLNERKIYLFMSYENLGSKTNPKIKSLQNFVTHTRELIRVHYNQNLFPKTA